MEKLKALEDRLRKIGEAYLMFSGGLDSCAILGAANYAKIKLTPVWINNGFGRANEKDIRLQASLISNNKVQVISLSPDDKVVSNPENRCYYCKGQIISAIKELAEDMPVLDGTTGSDNGYRPGKKALNEHGVISPLAELNISSAEAKKMAISMGADKNIADLESCMATRFNYGVPLLRAKIDIVKEIEGLIISKTADTNVRCRLDDVDHIRIELSKPESLMALVDNKFREQITLLGEKIALFTTVDLKPSRPNVYDKRIVQ